MGDSVGPSSEHRQVSPSNAPQPRSGTAEAVLAPSAETAAPLLGALKEGADGHGALRRMPGGHRPQTVLALQRTLGNAVTQQVLRRDTARAIRWEPPAPSATRSLMEPDLASAPDQRMAEEGPRSSAAPAPLAVQRAPAAAPSTESRLDDLERKERVLAKQTAALRVDQKWRPMFGEVIASRKAAVLRVSGGLNAASQGFQAAQVAQAQSDQLMIQLVGAAAAVVFAGAFEWVAMAGLGALGKSIDAAKSAVELIENPANALVSGAVNVTSAAAAQSSTARGQTPTTSAGSDALAFLTSQSEALELHTRAIEQAFATRADSMKNLTDEQWEQLDPNAQEAQFTALLQGIKQAGAGVEDMKDARSVALVLERQMWARWIPQQYAESIGADIEQGLIKAGVPELAGIKLSGHWYLPNSQGWLTKLFAWARTYSESVSTK